MTDSNPNQLRPFRPIVFGRYTLLTPLTTGGMGALFLARMEGMQGIQKLCVIKRIRSRHSENPAYVERFSNEAKTLVRLSHGSIVQVLDMGIVGEEPYLALEYVDGKDLRRTAARAREQGRKLPVAFVLFVMGRVLDALGYVHRKTDENGQPLNLVHRDLSPQNILVSYEGEVKIIDFGLVKGSLNASETHPSLMLGTFLYMSPEQLRHESVDLRTDLYAAGVCLYELLCGKNPFESDSVEKQLNLLMEGPERVIRELGPAFSPELTGLLLRALAVSPEDRFQSAEEFRTALQSCLMAEDPGVGAEAVGRVVRQLFEPEYAAERRRLGAMSAPDLEAAADLSLQDPAETTLTIENPLRETRLLPREEQGEPTQPSLFERLRRLRRPKLRAVPPELIWIVASGAVLLFLLAWVVTR